MLFLVIAVTEWIPEEHLALSLLSVYFIVAGAAWLLATLVQTRARPVQVLRLGQWLFCFVIAAVAWFAREDPAARAGILDAWGP